MQTHDRVANDATPRKPTRSRAQRARRVRLQYPAAFVELALVLGARLGTRQAADALGLRLSTMYRWIGQHRTSWSPRYTARLDVVVGALSERCERAGLHVRLPELAAQIGLSNRPQTSTQPIDCVIETNVDDEKSSSDLDENIARAKRIIDERFHEDLSCQRLADMVGLPRLKFIKQFAHAFGTPPYHYLIGVRVRAARERLAQTNEPLHVVAASVGFGSASSMQRAFKRFVGSSPARTVNTIAPADVVVPSHSYDAQKLSSRTTSIGDRRECVF